MKLQIILSAIIVITLVSCKKDNSTIEQPLLQDGPMSAQLGKLIYFRDYGYLKSPPFWGRNSDELFINASTEILRIDIAAKKVEIIENSGGMVTGKTNENSGIIFIGKINYQYGYYIYNFSSYSIEKIVSVPPNQGTNINIAGNNIFYSQFPASIPGPCTGGCWPYRPVTFYHLDKHTQQIKELKDKQFMLFSTDGSKTILSGHIERRIYIYDNTSRTIIDSADVNSNYASSFGLFIYNGVLHSFESDIHRNILIKNANTGQVIQQYQTNSFVFDDIRASTDGTMLYFSGGSNGTQKILLYDIATNTEKIIADLPYLQGGGLAFGDFVLSDDNKKIAIQVGNDLYIKVLD